MTEEQRSQPNRPDPQRDMMLDELQRMGLAPPVDAPRPAEAGSAPTGPGVAPARSEPGASADPAAPALPVSAPSAAPHGPPPEPAPGPRPFPSPNPARDQPVRRRTPSPAGSPPPEGATGPGAPRRAPAYDLPSEALRGPRGSLTSESLTAESVLKHRAPRPAGGWRRTVFALTGGTVNPGPSKQELRRAELVARARTPVQVCRRVAVISLKGGVGKTTTTAALGATFASLRGDRVIALDANPDRGTLGEKVPRETDATVRDLIAAEADLHRYDDVRPFTSQGPSRLEVLASDADPGASQAFSEADYRTAIDVLEVFYSLVLTDCGTGLLHSAMGGVLGLADQLVVVSSPSLDGARSASATLDWLEAHGHGALAAGAVAVISGVRPGRSDVDVGTLQEHFAARCRAVEQVPFDKHLGAGSVVDLEALSSRTREAYVRIAAAVGDGFATPRDPSKDTRP